MHTRRILLGVTGGIAAYKACELARLWRKQGAEVQVVMTAHAREFVAPLSFQALTGNAVRDTLFDPAHEAAMGHIELARWADAIVVAPCTANTLAKLALGLADDLLTTLALATDKPLFVAPAMNRLMWANAATQAHVKTLRSRGVRLLGPGSGEQACGEVGEGRMWAPEAIHQAVEAALAPARTPLRGLRAVVTAGPTQEAIDPVRFISNRSSGKQGYAVATALAEAGAEVMLISGPTALAVPESVKRVSVKSAQDMLAASLSACERADLCVAAAAVADYRVADVAAHKLKKQGDGGVQLQLVQNPDILARLRAAYPQLFLVGFAAETDNLEANARAKLQRKGLQMIAANWVGEGLTFEAEDNTLQLISAAAQQQLGPGSKLDVARQLVAKIAKAMGRD